MRTRALLSAILVSFLMAAPALAQEYTYKTVDVSCIAGATTCPAGLTPGALAAQTAARGINAGGDIVGFYVDAAGQQHGFLSRDGTFTSIDFPLAGVRATAANGINAEGDIVGQYTLPINPTLPEDSPFYCAIDPKPKTPDPSCIKGFLYRRGTFSTVMFPGHPGAIAQRITSNGDIYGCLHDHDLGMSMFGAAWTRLPGPKGSADIHATFSLTDNGGEVSNLVGVPMSMNNGATVGGQTIAGFLTDMGRQHGYLVRNGTVTTYDPTDATDVTAIWDMNASAHFVGAYHEVGEPAAKRHAFVQADEPSAPVTFDFSFTAADGTIITAFATAAFGISPNGVIVGQYTLAAGAALHGFIAFPPGRN